MSRVKNLRDPRPISWIFENLCCGGPFGAVSRDCDMLGESPFVIGRYGTASWNCSTTRRLLLFIANLTFSFRAQHTGTSPLCSFLLDSIEALSLNPNT
ncbi:hypothetical protein H5410_045515 [Solanum commersonii]|uniref:Uncharacterized protein n=1 Tax=Solanum commersonii TaxID=4109 RepID=A0A9J5X9R6_SOLCO|nr:hypothetical protein H5410_045515 [Solanum commersonii]